MPWKSTRAATLVIYSGNLESNRKLGERERKRGRKRETEKDRDRDRQTETGRDREIDRGRKREREREKKRETERQKQRQGETDREREREKERDSSKILIPSYRPLQSISEETAMLQNLKRVVEVWLDEYKETSYKAGKFQSLVRER